MDYKEKIITLLNDNDLSEEQKKEVYNLLLKITESENERMLRIIEDVICTNEAEQIVKTKYGLALTDLADWLEKLCEVKK